VDELIRQARRYKSRRDLMQMLERVARADVEIRSSPPDKGLVLERLVIDLAKIGSPARDASRSAGALPVR
jgi:DNA polymerase-3 subunit delta